VQGTGLDLAGLSRIAADQSSVFGDQSTMCLVCKKGGGLAGPVVPLEERDGRLPGLQLQGLSRHRFAELNQQRILQAFRPKVAGIAAGNHDNGGDLPRYAKVFGAMNR
jgi:hypothetical protein